MMNTNFSLVPLEIKEYSSVGASRSLDVLVLKGSITRLALISYRLS